MDLPVNYRINQNEIDETAGIVYQAAEDAAEAGETVKFSIRHYEDPHINLGRGLEELAEVPDELQFRRPGGGGYVVHDDTYCFGRAIPSSPKEDIKSERNRLGGELEKLLDKQFRQNVNYRPEEGDVYPGTLPLQVAGIGVADINEDFGSVTVVRACMYPETPSGELYQHGDLGSKVMPLDDLEEVEEQLENSFQEIEASEFISADNRERAEELQEEDGFREPDPCF